jgi:hypothetical protein
MPGSSSLQSTADVYSWLQNLLQVRARAFADSMRAL